MSIFCSFITFLNSSIVIRPSSLLSLFLRIFSKCKNPLDPFDANVLLILRSIILTYWTWLEETWDLFYDLLETCEDTYDLFLWSLFYSRALYALPLFCYFWIYSIFNFRKSPVAEFMSTFFCCCCTFEFLGSNYLLDDRLKEDLAGSSP